MRLMKIMTYTDFDEATFIVCLSFKFVVLMWQSVLYTIYSITLEFGYCKLGCVRLDKPESKDKVGERKDIAVCVCVYTYTKTI